MKCQISDVLKEYDKQFRSADNTDLINSAPFERNVDGVANIVISPITSEMYSLSLDFNCFDICLEDDRETIKLLGCLFYEAYNSVDVVDPNDPVYVGSRDEILLSNPYDYLNKFEHFLNSVDYGIGLALPFNYRFIVADNSYLDFECTSLLDIKYNPGNGLTEVQVKMDLRDDFLVLLKECKQIDIILDVN